MSGLEALPSEFAETRDALHQIAFFALSPAQYRAVGRMGLRATPGGFGTQHFDEVVDRVEGTLLVQEKGETVASATITTVRDAARFFGGEFQVDWFTDFRDPLEPFDPDRPVHVTESASMALARWFGFAFDTLGSLGGGRRESEQVSEVQLWPEHFDPALEMGESGSGQRASYGCSPGDRNHPHPYLYVAAWGEIDRGVRYWNDGGFNGASFGYDDLRATSDPAATALEFFEEGYRLLSAD